MINEERLFTLLERIACALETTATPKKNTGRGSKRGTKKEGGWGNPDASTLPAATIFGSNAAFHEYLAKFIAASKAVGNHTISTRKLAKIVRKEFNLGDKSITFYNALFDGDKYKKLGLEKVSQYVFKIL